MLNFIMVYYSVCCLDGFGPNKSYFTLEDLINHEPVPYLEDETENFLFIMYIQTGKNKLHIYKINKSSNRIVDYRYKYLNLLI